MPDARLLAALEDIGLNEKEAAVYYAALQLGGCGASDIARISGIKRTTVYSIIESLRGKSLMTVQYSGLRKQYVAEHPDRLERILETRRATLQHVLPEFTALYNLKGGESSIKLYEGIQAMKDVYEGLLEAIRPGEDYMIVSSMQQWYDLAPDYFQDFTERRAELCRRIGFRIRLLVEETPIARQHKKIETSLAEHIKYLPASTKLTTNMVVIPAKVVIHQLVPPITAMVIENPNIVRMHSELFELLWSTISEPT